MPEQSVTVDGQRIDHVIAKGDSPFTISGVLAFPAKDDDVYLTATDTRMLGVIRAPGHVDGPSIIPPEVLSKRKGGDAYAFDGTTWRSLKGGKAAPAMKGKFPKCVDCIPEAAPDHTVVRIDAAGLAKLAGMIGEDGYVTLIIGERNHVIGVRGVNGIGAVMPLYHDDTTITDFNAARADYAAAFTQ